VNTENVGGAFGLDWAGGITEQCRVQKNLEGMSKGPLPGEREGRQGEGKGKGKPAPHAAGLGWEEKGRRRDRWTAKNKKKGGPKDQTERGCTLGSGS